MDECKTTFVHEMKITRIFESPRVTKPYSEEQWEEIETLGHRIEAIELGTVPRFAKDDSVRVVIPPDHSWVFPNTAA